MLQRPQKWEKNNNKKKPTCARKSKLKHPKLRHEGSLSPKQNPSPLKPCGDQGKLHFWSFQKKGDPPVIPDRNGQEQLKVLECRNRDQTFQQQGKLSQLWSPQEQKREILKGSTDRSAPNLLLLPLQGAVPGLFLQILNSQDLLAQECPGFNNKVTLMQGKYKYVLWLLHIVPPKRAQRFLFNWIVRNHHKKSALIQQKKNNLHTELRDQGTGMPSHLLFYTQSFSWSLHSQGQ